MNPLAEKISIEFKRGYLPDLDEILVNERLAYSIPWSEQNMKNCLGENYICFLMLDNHKIIGHMIILKVLDEIQLLNVCVIPDFQGQGLGSIWLEYLFQFGQKESCNSIVLEVRASNKSAKLLYRKHGFFKIGVRKNYYPNPPQAREDALVLQVLLS